MAFNDSLKLKAIRLHNEQELDPSAVHALLVDEDGFNGTRQIVSYWINHKRDILQKIELSQKIEEGEESTDTMSDNTDLIEDLESAHTIDDDDYGADLDEISGKEFRKLYRSRQNLMDTNRILRKTFREQDRVITATKALLQKILSQVPARVKVDFTPTCAREGDPAVAIIQFSDWHLNECVLREDTKGKNEYNFKVASQRMQKYACELIELFDALNVRSVVLALTGDQFNSTRRKDEILRMAARLSTGFLIGAGMIANFIQDIASRYNMEVVSIFGNESRLDDEISSVDFANNFDYLLHHFLQAHLVDQDNVVFHPVAPDHELVINVNGANILLWHGHNRASADKLITKYAKKGIIIHYIITGHLHHTMLKEEVGQSGSGVGDNAYSYHRLNVVSRASQNCYIVRSELGSNWPNIKPIPIDLQYADNFPGYSIPEDSDAFGLRDSKTKGGGETILRIVV